MRNLPGSLGRSEFYIVILCIPERTYVFLSPKVGNEPIGNGNEYTMIWFTQDIQMIYK